MKKLLCTAVFAFIASLAFSHGQAATVPNNMVRINGGTFTMGSPANESERFSEETQHQVTVSTFYMGKHEVTQKEWVEVMGEYFAFEEDDYPLYYVNWYDAIEYCNRRSLKEGLTPAYTIDKDLGDPNNENESDELRWVVAWNRNANGYRLPTEAEWEYACRAGTLTPFNTGNNITTNQANYNGEYPYNNNPAGENRESLTAVGSFTPNAWGLYDMHGNVLEWCWDWYGNYSSGKQANPMGAVSSAARVARGGSWSNGGAHLRSAFRGYGGPSDRYENFGFRVVRN